MMNLYATVEELREAVRLSGAARLRRRRSS